MPSLTVGLFILITVEFTRMEIPFYNDLLLLLYILLTTKTTTHNTLWFRVNLFRSLFYDKSDHYDVIIMGVYCKAFV